MEVTSYVYKTSNLQFSWSLAFDTSDSPTLGFEGTNWRRTVSHVFVDASVAMETSVVTCGGPRLVHN